MRMRQCRGDAEHRRVRHIGRGEPLFPFGDGARFGDVRDQPVEFVAVVAPQGRRQKARIIRELRPFDRLAQLAPEALGQDGDNDRAVRRRKAAIGHDVGVARPHRFRVLAGDESELRKIAEHADEAVMKADIDEPPGSGLRALVQRGEDRHRPEHAADHIAERNAELHRHMAALAIDAERTRQGLRHDVERRLVA